MKTLTRAAILVSVLCGSVPAQHSDAGPVVLRITLPRSTICLGTGEVDVEAELRNTSRSKVRLSLAGLGYATSFMYHGCSLDDSFRTMDTWGDPFPGQGRVRLVTLGPGRSYRISWKLKLDAGFFTSAGIYSVVIQYSGLFGGSRVKRAFHGFLESNEVFFSIQNCETLDPDRR